MRKFLLASCLSLFCTLVMAAEDSQNSPLLAGLKAFRGPMTQMAAEAGKGRQANFDVVDKAIVEADAAWKSAMSEPIDLERYRIPADQHDDVRRQVRLLDMLLSHMGDAHKRGERVLVLRTVQRMPEPYNKLAATLGLP